MLSNATFAALAVAGYALYVAGGDTGWFSLLFGALFIAVAVACVWRPGLVMTGDPERPLTRKHVIWRVVLVTLSALFVLTSIITVGFTSTGAPALAAVAVFNSPDPFRARH